MKNKIVNVSLSVVFALMALTYFLLKQNPMVVTIFENIRNPFVLPVYGMIQKLGWDLFSTLGIIIFVTLSIYFAFIFKYEKN